MLGCDEGEEGGEEEDVCFWGHVCLSSSFLFFLAMLVVFFRDVRICGSEVEEKKQPSFQLTIQTSCLWHHSYNGTLYDFFPKEASEESFVTVASRGREMIGEPLLPITDLGASCRW